MFTCNGKMLGVNIFLIFYSFYSSNQSLYLWTHVDTCQTLIGDDVAFSLILVEGPSPSLGKPE
jgi:hypothetical protein